MSRTIEEIIQEAMQRGEFDDLPGKGKPIDLSEYFNTPEEVRLAFSILKNADILPVEAELLKEIAVLRKEFETCTDPDRRRQIGREIETRLLKYRVRTEKRR